MKKRLKILIPILVIAVAVSAYFLYFKKPIDPNQVKVSGNIEVTTVGVGFKIAGHVDRRLVDEGETVKKGQIVAKLETADLELDVANARAQLLAAQATLAQLANGSRPQDVSVAQAALRSAQADKQNAAVEYERMRRLFAQGAVSAQERDRSQTAFATATARADQTVQQLSLVVEGPRREEIDLAAARVEQMKQVQKLAQTRLGYAQITAPVDGVVLSKNIEAGDFRQTQAAVGQHPTLIAHQDSFRHRIQTQRQSLRVELPDLPPGDPCPDDFFHNLEHAPRLPSQCRRHFRRQLDAAERVRHQLQNFEHLRFLQMKMPIYLIGFAQPQRGVAVGRGDSPILGRQPVQGFIADVENHFRLVLKMEIQRPRRNPGGCRNLAHAGPMIPLGQKQVFRPLQN